MKEYAFKCVLSLKNNIRIVAENFNSFKHWTCELATFEVPRYPMNDVIIRQLRHRKKILKSSEFLFSGVDYVLPWSLFVKVDCYISKCLF